MTKSVLRGKLLVLLMAICISPVLPKSQEQADQARLAAILEKSAGYCQRLDRAALDFVCFEEVTETSRHYTLHTDIYLYDYQFVRKDKETKERRNLISVNGQKTNVKDSSLNTVMFQYKNVLFGPVGLLSKSWQTYLSYKVIGEDTIQNQPAVVIEATPGPLLVEPHCTGKIWVKEDDGSVLKIVWDQKTLGNFQSVAEWAEVHDAEPQITAYSEYGLEKNGLRFPSRSFSEQAYITKDRGKYINAQIFTFYKSYKFFTVETEIKY